MKITRRQLRKAIKEELDHINQQHCLTESTEDQGSIVEVVPAPGTGEEYQGSPEGRRIAIAGTDEKEILALLKIVRTMVTGIEKQTGETLRLWKEWNKSQA